MKKNILAKSIRRFYLIKLFPAALFLIFVILIWLNYPFKEIFFPDTVNSINDINEHYYSKKEFIRIDPPTLYYTGYDYQRHGDIKGSYYYTFIDEKCVFFLLSPDTNKTESPELTDLTIKGRLIRGSTSYKELVEHVAKELSWTAKGLKSVTSPIVISEIDYFIPESILFLILLSVSSVPAFYYFVSRVIFVIAPQFSPSCMHMRYMGRRSALLKQADHEFLSESVFSTDTLFLTSNYLIEISARGIATVPLRSILWIYKHSVMTRFLWFPPKLTYTIRIVSLYGISDHAKLEKTHADEILSKIEAACPDVISGFSEEKRKLIKEKRKALKRKH